MAIVPNTYSFQNFSGAIIDEAGGGSFSLGGGDYSGIAPDGVGFAYDDAKITKNIGADGTPMYSLHATRGGKFTLRLQQTSPLNAILSEMYRFTTAPSGANTGQINITGGDIQRGDNIVAAQCAIMKHPDVTYGVEGAVREWVFEVGILNATLGAGFPG